MNSDTPSTKNAVPEKSSFHIRLPDAAEMNLDQDEEFCLLEIDGAERKIRFHDYDEVYSQPGLYEYLIYELLECRSPQVVCRLLGDQVHTSGQAPEKLRVLDLGAGNGIVGEELRKLGAQLVVGVDIIPEAASSAERDRPGVYDDYLVADIADPGAAERKRLVDHQFNALTCVGALGFGDLPPEAFGVAFNYVADGGWVAFTIKERFLTDADSSGFGRLINRCADEGILEVHTSERYQHRLNVNKEPIHYTAIIATKQRNIPVEFFDA